MLPLRHETEGEAIKKTVKNHYFMTKPKAVCVDLDGTLCDTSWRTHFVTGEKKNWKAFYAGIPHDPIRLDVLAQVIHVWSTQDAQIVFVTGRGIEYLSETMDWFDRQGLSVVLSDAPLYMRPAGDHRPDTEVKKELFEKVMDRYEVILAFEDRPHIIEMIKELGIRVIGV